MGEENVFENHQSASSFLHLLAPALLLRASKNGAHLAVAEEQKSVAALLLS